MPYCLKQIRINSIPFLPISLKKLAFYRLFLSFILTDYSFKKEAKKYGWFDYEIIFVYIYIIPFQYRRESSRLYWDGHCTYNRVGTVQPNNGTTMYNIEYNDDRNTRIGEKYNTTKCWKYLRIFLESSHSLLVLLTAAPYNNQWPEKAVDQRVVYLEKWKVQDFFYITTSHQNTPLLSTYLYTRISIK